MKRVATKRLGRKEEGIPIQNSGAQQNPNTATENTTNRSEARVRIRPEVRRGGNLVFVLVALYSVLSSTEFLVARCLVSWG